MITVEKLKSFGANTDEGIKRCAGRDSLYLKLVNTIPSNEGFRNLYEAINNKDFDKAFEYAHGLKGIITNLSLTPLEEPIIYITEELRASHNIDYAPYLAKLEELRLKLEQL